MSADAGPPKDIDGFVVRPCLMCTHWSGVRYRDGRPFPSGRLSRSGYSCSGYCDELHSPEIAATLATLDRSYDDGLFQAAIEGALERRK